jgi:zinc protease
VPTTKDSKLSVNRKIAPPIKDAIEFNIDLKPYKKFVLDNGVDVYTVDAGEKEVLQLEVVFHAGNSYETANGIASAVNYMLKSGTSTKTSFQLNEQFEYYGAFCKQSCHNETSLVTLHTLTKYLPHLLPVIKDMITDAAFPEQELNIYKQNSKQRLSVNLKKCDFVAHRLIDVYLFGADHPYGKFSTAEMYDALDVQQLKAFFNQYYLNGNCTIFVSGKLPEDLQQQLNDNFGKLSITSRHLPLGTHEVAPATEKKYRVNNDADGVQGAIRIARPFPNRHHPDFTKVMVLNALFGGFFGSRLMSNIREEKGYTYGIHSYLQNNIECSAWMISTEAGKDVCEATIAEVYKEMKNLREELVDDEELLLVKNYMLGGVLGDMDGPFQIMSRWKNIVLNQLDEQYFYTSIDTIKNITAEEIKELAQKYLKEEDFYELVVI